MNSFIRAGARSCISIMNSNSRCIVPVVNKCLPTTPAYSRTLWHMCSSKSGINSKFLKPQPTTELCHCGCSGLLHTRSEKELADFLKEEITAEKQTQKITKLPVELDGFKISADEAELTLIKETQLETIKIQLNVNLSVDGDDGTEVDQPTDKPDSNLQAKPDFDIDIVRKGKTLSFSCSFVESSGATEEYNDVFGIDEITFFEGEWNENTYSVSGDVLDGYLYDLLMTILEEKGISNEFVEKLSELATAHEHTKYIGLLENISKFISVN